MKWITTIGGIVAITAATAIAAAATSAPSSLFPCRAPEEGESCTDVFQVRTDGKRARLLERNPALIPSQPVVDISRDFRWIAVTQEYGYLFAGRVDGHRAFSLTHSPTGTEAARFSPDGTKIAFQDGYAVWIAQANGRYATQVADDAGFPAWSPDSRRLAFVTKLTNAGNGRVGFSGTIATAALDGSNYRELAVWNSAQRGPSLAWSPDGRWLSYVSASASGDPDVHVLALDEGRERALIEGAAAPTWSPDGERIAFARPAHLPMRIWVAAADGTAQRELPATTFVAPRWSPNGRWIAYVGASTGGRVALRVTRPDGSRTRTVRTLPVAVEVEQIFWSKDSRRLAYVREVRPHGPRS